MRRDILGEMDDEVDHYAVLGLPSGEEGAALSLQEINEAYRSKARALHLDQSHDDPNAHAAFVKLQTSYEVLKDKKELMLFHERLQEKLRLRRQMFVSRGRERILVEKLQSLSIKKL